MSGEMVDEARFAAVERGLAVHEAVCLERYKAINFKLNVAITGLFIILAAISVDNPLVAFLRRLAGG